MVQTYSHQYHIVWIPKYRTRVLKGELKTYLAKQLFEIHQDHPEVEIEKFNIQIDHVQLVSVVPPKYSVSSVVGKIKANTSRRIRVDLPWIKKLYWGNEIWLPGFFSSTVEINEKIIKKFVEFQENVDMGKMQLDFGF